MRYLLATLTLLLMTLQATAQFFVGNQGMTVLAGTPLTVDGLTLTPSTSLSIANNSISLTPTPLVDKPSINRVYRLGAPLVFSGTVELSYLTTELNGYPESTLQLAYSSGSNTSLTLTTASRVNPTTHSIANSLNSKTLVAVTATALPDLAPILYARPNVAYGPTPLTVVVDVLELTGVPTHGQITVRVSKDPLFSLSFDDQASSVGGRSVNNSAWRFDASSDGSYYLLTTNQPLIAGGTLSFGLSGRLDPPAMRGDIMVSSVLEVGSGGEVKVTNNTDVNKIDYFQP